MTIFTQIMNGEIPGRFIYQDDRCSAFLTIAPLTPGHTLVVPREEIEHWMDLDQDLRHHLFDVAHTIGRGIEQVWEPAKIGVMIAGLEVPHCHIHVTGINDVTDLDFANADTDATPEELDAARDVLTAALTALDVDGVVNAD